MWTKDLQRILVLASATLILLIAFILDLWILDLVGTSAFKETLIKLLAVGGISVGAVICVILLLNLQRRTDREEK